MQSLNSSLDHGLNQSMSQEFISSSFPAMYLPLQMDGLLVPDVVVAEIMAPGKITQKLKSPEWYVGSINWRGRKLPLVSFESLNGASTVSPENVTRVAVLNGLADHGHLPFYAIVVNGQPALLNISEDDIEVHEGRPRGRAEAMSIAVKELTAGIPNIEWVEQHLLAYTLNS